MATLCWNAPCRSGAPLSASCSSAQTHSACNRTLRRAHILHFDCIHSPHIYILPTLFCLEKLPPILGTGLLLSCVSNMHYPTAQQQLIGTPCLRMPTFNLCNTVFHYRKLKHKTKSSPPLETYATRLGESNFLEFMSRHWKPTRFLWGIPQTTAVGKLCDLLWRMPPINTKYYKYQLSMSFSSHCSSLSTRHALVSRTHKTNNIC